MIAFLLAGIAAVALIAALAPSARAADVGGEVAPGIGVGDASDLPVTGPDKGESASTDRQPRIVNGTPIDISQAPWQVAVTVRETFRPGNALQRQFCGGTLVAPNMVITAAHCIFNESGTGFNLAPADISVVSGRTVLSSAQGQEIPVANYFFFVDTATGLPLYNPQNGAFDVAVFQLGSASASPPVKLVGLDETSLWSFGRQLTVSGWGATSEGGQGSDTLLAAEIYSLKDSNCRDSFQGAFDTRTSFCAGLLSGARDSCQGDSGGPLVALTADGTSRLVGNVQAGVGCARQLSPGAYGRFGAEPLNGALRALGQQIAGTEIAGSGGVALATISREQALELSFSFANDKCAKKGRKCQGFAASGCRAQGGGFKCRTRVILRKRGRKIACSQQLLWTADTQAVDFEPVTKNKCK